MKNYILAICVMCTSLNILAQEKEPENILTTDANWGHEHFTFPIKFAKEIPLEGIEEAVFPKGWGKTDSSEFWSYAFIWDVTATNPLTTNQFEEYIQIYFDGLMNIRDLKNGDTILPTNALFIENENSGDIRNYTGKIRIYEGRYTKKMMILNVQATQRFCEKEKKSFTIFRFSPSDFNAEIWNALNNVLLKNDTCQH